MDRISHSAPSHTVRPLTQCALSHSAPSHTVGVGATVLSKLVATCRVVQNRIYTPVYDHIFGGVPAKDTVFKPYINIWFWPTLDIFWPTLYIFWLTLYVFWPTLYIYSGQPYIYSGQPYIYSGQPYIFSGQPYIYILANPSHLSFQGAGPYEPMAKCEPWCLRELIMGQTELLSILLAGVGPWACGSMRVSQRAVRVWRTVRKHVGASGNFSHCSKGCCGDTFC